MFSYFYIVNIGIILVFVSLFFVTRNLNKRWSKINDYLGKVTNTVDSVRYGDLTRKMNKFDHPTYQNVTYSINRMVETLNDREKMIAEYQAELMKQNRLLESVINSLSDGILIINDKSEILRATPNILKWFGIKKGSNILGKNVFDYISLANNNVKIDQLTDEEVFIRHSSTDNFIINSQPLQQLEKKRYVLIIKNVTKDKEVETLKADFVATLTHDLKVPIIAASNMIDLFLARKFGEISDKQEFALDSMKSSNKELLDLVQIMLETYKISDKGIELYKEEININNFVENIVNEVRPLANNVSLDIKFYPSSENPIIFADAIQMQRVVKNLLSNAIDHSNSKQDIEVYIKLSSMVEISVVDFGQGINEDDLKMVFNKYYSAAKKMRKVGTGLGLYLSQKIVEAHGGEIIAESEKNVRTEFCVKLPLT